MKAEDTVMDTPECWRVISERDMYGTRIAQTLDEEWRAVAKAQAEITWQKAEEHFGKQNAIAFSSGVQTGRVQGKRTGIKEVVGWIKQTAVWHIKNGREFIVGYELDPDEWQAKLKEWRVDKTSAWGKLHRDDTNGKFDGEL